MFRPTHTVRDVLTSLVADERDTRCDVDTDDESGGLSASDGKCEPVHPAPAPANKIFSDAFSLSVRPVVESVLHVIASGLYSLRSVEGRAYPMYCGYHGYTVRFEEKYKVWQLLDESGERVAESQTSADGVRGPYDLRWQYTASGRAAVVLRRQTRGASAASVQFKDQMERLQRRFALRRAVALDRTGLTEMVNRIQNVFGSMEDKATRRSRWNACRMQLAGHRVGKFLSLVRALQRRYRGYIVERNARCAAVLAAWQEDDAARKVQLKKRLRKMVNVQSGRATEYSRKIAALNGVNDAQRKAAIMKHYRGYVVKVWKATGWKSRVNVCEQALPMDDDASLATLLTSLRATLTALQNEWHHARTASILSATEAVTDADSEAGGDDAGAQLREAAARVPADPAVFSLLLIHWQPPQDRVTEKLQKAVQRDVTAALLREPSSLFRSSSRSGKLKSPALTWGADLGIGAATPDQPALPRRCGSSGGQAYAIPRRPGGENTNIGRAKAPSFNLDPVTIPKRERVVVMVSEAPEASHSETRAMTGTLRPALKVREKSDFGSPSSPLDAIGGDAVSECSCSSATSTPNGCLLPIHPCPPAVHSSPTLSLMPPRRSPAGAHLAPRSPAEAVPFPSPLLGKGASFCVDKRRNFDDASTPSPAQGTPWGLGKNLTSSPLVPPMRRSETSRDMSRDRGGRWVAIQPLLERPFEGGPPLLPSLSQHREDAVERPDVP
eukprot:TRINITY_DN7512_c0_g1_i1.p1 TRINITY_DN7512_c0_g1~~TRINITY_DN7512_c0_g1_i1.p1  ORF type:complete len:726 (+),score=197.98 TRINITY_DN7512_c0_g1_i1:49-2226(+)